MALKRSKMNDGNSRKMRPTLANDVADSRFAAEEWEAWMKWDGPLEALSATSSQSVSPSDLASPPNALLSSTGSTPPDQKPLPSFLPSASDNLITPPMSENRKRRMTRDEASKNNKQPGSKKVSHNVIEKRYRSNLNDKIAKLRDSVPSLRSAMNASKKVATKASISDTDGSGDEANTGLKFNKATVLTKAIEYIQQLEKQNQRLQEENSVLRNRLHGIEKLRDAPTYLEVHKDFTDADSSMTDLTSSESRVGDVDGSVTSFEEVTGMIKTPEHMRRVRKPSLKTHYIPNVTGSPGSEDRAAPVEGPNFNFKDVKGMIVLPPEFQRLRDEASQEHYAPPPIPRSRRPSALQDPILDENNGGWPRGRVMSRVLVGSLACLMIMEGISEREPETDPHQGRGLFALPQELLQESRGFRDPIRKRIIAFATSRQAQKIFPVFKFSLVMFILLFVLFYVASRLESKYLPGPVIDDSAHATLNGEDTDTISEPDTPRRPYYHARDFFAKIAIGWFDFFRPNNHDDYAASVRARRREKDFRRRYKTYADTIPKLLDERNT
jgi:hypothetical protein